MKVSTTTLVLAAALGVVAHPSGFAHRNIHHQMEKRLDFVMNTKPQPPAADANKAAVVPSPTTSAPPPPPPATTKAAQPTPASGSGKKQFCGGNSKRATAADIAYKGNVGTSSSYGCNLMMVDSADDYEYTATFDNNSGKDQKCAVWLKIGRDNGINGFFKGNEVINFDLPAGSKKVLAAEANSQGGATCGEGSVPTSPIGLFGGTWLEFDFASTINKGYSGADASCLTAADTGLPIPALKVCAKGTTVCSTVNNGGSGTNAYLKGMNAEDGVGLNLNPGPVALLVTVG